PTASSSWPWRTGGRESHLRSEDGSWNGSSAAGTRRPGAPDSALRSSESWSTSGAGRLRCRPAAREARAWGSTCRPSRATRRPSEPNPRSRAAPAGSKWASTLASPYRSRDYAEIVKRALIVIAWGVAGLLIAGALSLGAFALAGNDLGKTTSFAIHSEVERQSGRESPEPIESPGKQGGKDDHPSESPSADDHGGSSGGPSSGSGSSISSSSGGSTSGSSGQSDSGSPSGSPDNSHPDSHDDSGSDHGGGDD